MRTHPMNATATAVGGKANLARNCTQVSRPFFSFLNFLQEGRGGGGRKNEWRSNKEKWQPKFLQLSEIRLPVTLSSIFSLSFSPFLHPSPPPHSSSQKVHSSVRPLYIFLPAGRDNFANGIKPTGRLKNQQPLTERERGSTWSPFLSSPFSLFLFVRPKFSILREKFCNSPPPHIPLLLSLPSPPPNDTFPSGLF